MRRGCACGEIRWRHLWGQCGAEACGPRTHDAIDRACRYGACSCARARVYVCVCARARGGRTMSSIVMDVSAMFVATMIFRSAPYDANTARCASAARQLRNRWRGCASFRRASAPRAVRQSRTPHGRWARSAAEALRRCEAHASATQRWGEGVFLLPRRPTAGGGGACLLVRRYHRVQWQNAPARRALGARASMRPPPLQLFDAVTDLGPAASQITTNHKFRSQPAAESPWHRAEATQAVCAACLVHCSPHGGPGLTPGGTRGWLRRAHARRCAPRARRSAGSPPLRPACAAAPAAAAPSHSPAAAAAAAVGGRRAARQPTRR